MRAKLFAAGRFLLVTLPSLFMLLWTVDAAIVPGADVFIITGIQFLFLLVYVVWAERKLGATSVDDPTESDSTEATEV